MEAEYLHKIGHTVQGKQVLILKVLELFKSKFVKID